MDITWLHQFNQVYTHPFLDGFMILVTTAGLLLCPLLGILFMLKQQQQLGRAIFATLIGGFLLTLLFWGLSQRPRPEEVRLLLSSPPFPSYPSGHTVAAFGTATVIALAYRKAHWWLLLFGGAALIAYSRLYLGAHYPSDVLAGMILGIGTGAACYGLFMSQQPYPQRLSWLLWPQIAFAFLGTYMAYLDILPWHLLQWPFADKVLHFLLFGVITFWFSIWLGPQMIRWRGISLPLAVLIPFAFAILEESLQYFSSVRTLSLTDLLSNLAGMIFFWWLSRRLFAETLIEPSKEAVSEFS